MWLLFILGGSYNKSWKNLWTLGPISGKELFRPHTMAMIPPVIDADANNDNSNNVHYNKKSGTELPQNKSIESREVPITIDDAFFSPLTNICIASLDSNQNRIVI